MSSRGSAAWAKPLRFEDIKSLAKHLPYQRVRDTPIHPYYTDWRAFEPAEEAPWAEAAARPALAYREAHASLSPGGAEIRAVPGGFQVEPLGRDAVAMWRLPIEGRLDAIHALRWRHGLRVTVSGRGEQHLVVEVLGGSGYSGYHIMINVEDGARGRVVLVTYAPRNGILTYSLEAVVGDRADFELATVNLGSGAVYARRLIGVGSEARYTGRVASLGGVMVRDREDAYVVGDRASAEIRASLHSGEGEKLDSIQNVIIRGSEAEGSVQVRAIVNGSGYLVSRGVGRVERQSTDSSVVYESYVLVLDEGGKGYSVPVLEVDTGMVREARHSTAVLAPPEDVVFYLRQRGLSDREIRALLTSSTLEYSGALQALGVDPASLAESLLEKH